MSTPSPLLFHDLTVVQDHGQFWLSGDTAPEQYDMDLLHEAINGSGVAGNGHTVVVLSPHQNNFQMSLRIEVWGETPPDDRAAWQEVFQSGITVKGNTLQYDSPADSWTRCQVPDGRYAMRICGQGFVKRGWPGSTRPGDSWRVQLWPTTASPNHRRLKAWQKPASAGAPGPGLGRRLGPTLPTPAPPAGRPPGPGSRRAIPETGP